MEKQTEYSKQVILSTDGKHTIIASGNTQADMVEAIKWATAAYDKMVKRYGLKYEQYAKTNGSNNHANGDTVPTCGVHKLPMTRVNGKFGAFWSCRQRNEDGSFCKFKPYTV